MLLTSTPALARRLASYSGGTALPSNVSGCPWTDDYSNLLGARRR